MKVAIVTGASSGIGREISLLLAKEDTVEEIWLIARRTERLTALSESLTVKSRIFPLDVTKTDAAETLAAALRECDAEVTYAVLAAGAGVIGDLTKVPIEEQTAIIDLNCRSQVSFLYHIVPFMKKGAHVIGIASAAAFCPQPGFSVYAATKSFYLSFLRGVRTELRPRGISVTAVCPGPAKTEFFDVAEKHAKMSAFKKTFFTTPEKVARVSLRAAKRNRAVATPTFIMKLFRVLAKIMPHGLLCAIMGGSEDA